MSKKLIIFRGQGTRTLCAVPEDMVGPNGVDRVKYVASGWATRNAGLNLNSIGSHLFPSTRRIHGQEAAEYTLVAERAG
jgi:hypothetical protein